MKKTKNYLVLGAAALGLIAILANPGCSTRRTGWVEDDGQYYYYNDRGRMVTGWLVRADGSYYLMDDGVRAAGWQQIDGKNYYFDSYGMMCTGWQEIGGNRYLLGSDGAQCFGLTQYAGRTCYLDENGVAVIGWAEVDGRTYYFLEDGFCAIGLTTIDGANYIFDAQGVMLTGTVELEGKTHYLADNGMVFAGWQQIDGKPHYFNADGTVCNGWVQDGGHTYYVENSVCATGIVKLEGKTHFFDSRGWEIIMVNPWNSTPDDYKMELVSIGGEQSMAAEAAAAFEILNQDMIAIGKGPKVNSTYRSAEKQKELFDQRVAAYMNEEGLSEEQAISIVSRSVAIPGTSEHQLGLAVDISDATYVRMDASQMETPTQLWMIDNSWRYGFILRYPNGKSRITGIEYEPWHYRYVGKELAAELYELNLTMEEYLDMLTEDKSLTASNPANGNTAK